MPTREQLTHERLEALIDLLDEAGVIDEQINDELDRTRELGAAREIVEQAEPSNTASEVSRIDFGGGE